MSQMQLSNKQAQELPKLASFTSFLVGFTLITTPWMGVASLYFVSILLLILTYRTEHAFLKRLNWSWPWLGLVWCWAVILVLVPFDLRSPGILWQQIAQDQELLGVLSLYWRWFSSLEHMSALRLALQYTILVGLFSAWEMQPQLRFYVWRGIWCAFPIAVLVAIVQMLELYGISGIEDLTPPLTQLWRSQFRVAGTLTDPNALGVICALLLPMVCVGWREASWIERILKILGLVCALGCGLAAGSRSFIASIIIIVLVVAWRRQRQWVRTVFYSLLIVLLVWNIALIFLPWLLVDLIAYLPTNIERIVMTFSWPSAHEALFSRIAFFQIGFETWKQSPILGVGVGQFSNYVEASSTALGLDLGGWRDNANNFYLGVLSETGIIGSVALFATFARLQFAVTRNDRSTAAQLSITAFIVILFLGPHLEFVEISVLVALLMSEALKIRSYDKAGTEILSKLVCATIVVAICIQVMGSDWGLYAPERDSGRRYSWSRGIAQMNVQCDSTSNAAIYVRAVFPSGVTDVQTIIIATDDQILQKSLSSNQEHIFEVKCQPGRETQTLRMQVSNPWIPRAFRIGRDLRILGVQVAGNT